MGHLTKICMTVYLIYRGEKAAEVVRMVPRVKFVCDFT